METIQSELDLLRQLIGEASKLIDTLQAQKRQLETDLAYAQQEIRGYKPQLVELGILRQIATHASELAPTEPNKELIRLCSVWMGDPDWFAECYPGEAGEDWTDQETVQRETMAERREEAKYLDSVDRAAMAAEYLRDRARGF
jgi:chromosome segregation ATPase